MRPDALYLHDIVAAADEVAAFLEGWTEERFSANSVMRSAVLHQLAVVGEAAARVSQPLRARHPEVSWPDVVTFRNIIVHAYFALDWHVVWMAATANLPALRAQVAAILAAECGEDGMPG